MSKKIIWIKESEAAEKLGYEPRTLRRYCKQGKLLISYTHINGRSFKYSQKDVDRLINENAFIIY